MVTQTERRAATRAVSEAEWQAFSEGRPTGLVWAVATTGIHCRDGCPGRPLRKNLRVAATRAAAEAAGFRAGDLAAAEAFYAGTLGLEVIVKVPGRHVFFRVGQGVLLVFNPEATAEPPRNPALPVPPHGATGPGHLCFAVPRAEIARWRDRLTAAGIPIEAEFDWPNGARSLYFRDPAGNSLELAEPRLWEG